MTLGIGTLHTRHHQPVRVINAVYPVQTRAQRRLLAHNAGHMGRLVGLGVALVITAFAVFTAGGSSDTQAASAGGLPVIVPEARSAAHVIDVTPSWQAYQLTLESEGRA